MADARSIGELEIQEEILKLLQDLREWSNAELKEKLRHLLLWSEADLEVSAERPNEFLWEQRVNNSLSPARSASLYAKGFVEHGHERGTHRITEKGLRFIREEWSFEEVLDEIAPPQSSSGADCISAICSGVAGPSSTYNSGVIAKASTGQPPPPPPSSLGHSLSLCVVEAP